MVALQGPDVQQRLAFYVCSVWDEILQPFHCKPSVSVLRPKSVVAFKKADMCPVWAVFLFCFKWIPIIKLASLRGLAIS